MTFRWDVSDHPAAVGPLQSALRSISKSRAAGLRRLFTDTLQSAPIITRGGVYVEEGARFEVDMNRIYGVVQRIIRGLHYKKTGVPIPVEQRVIVLDDETLEQFAPVHRNEILRTLAPMLQGEPEVFGEETFLFFGKAKKIPQHRSGFWFFFSDHFLGCDIPTINPYDTLEFTRDATYHPVIIRIRTRRGVSVCVSMKKSGPFRPA